MRYKDFQIGNEGRRWTVAEHSERLEGASPKRNGARSDHYMLHPRAHERLAGLKGDDFLFHLLDCPRCRDLAVAGLGDWAAVRASEPPPPLIDPAYRPVAEALFAELAQLAPERLEVFQDERFHDPALLDLIVEKGEAAARTKDYPGAAELAWLAVDLAGCIASEDSWVHARLARGFVLAGSARRLAGDLEQAQDAFDSGSIYLTGGTAGLLHRAWYCRGLALVRWDRHSLDEAAGLLRRAAEAFAELGRRAEEGSCLALLGLLHVEAGEFARALGPLRRADFTIAAEACPCLAVRSSLALALCFAVFERQEEARQTLKAARSLYPLVEDGSEQPVIQALEGKVASWLEDAKAHTLLDAARQSFLAEQRWVEAGLAALDLAALCPRAQRPGEVERLSADLRRQSQGPQGQHAGALAIEALHGLPAGGIAGIGAPARLCAAFHGSQLLKMARLRRLGAPPVPWV